MTESIEKMRQAVLADAEKKAQRLLRNVQNEVDKNLKETEAQALKRRQEQLEKHQQKLDEQYKAIINHADIEIKRLWLNKRETIFRQVLQQSLQQIQTQPVERRRQSILVLITEGLTQFSPQTAVCLTMDKQSAALFGANPLAEIQRLLPTQTASYSLSLVIDETQDSGVILTSADGRQQIDNRYNSILNHNETAFRIYTSQALSDIINQGPESHPKQH